MDKKTICGIVKTLYPSYQEQLVTESSRILIEKHLNECRDCQKLYRQQDNASALRSRQKKETGYLRRYRSMFFTTIGGTLLGFLLCCILLYGALRLGFRFSSVAYSTDSISEYGEFQKYNGLSKLMIFPETLPDSASDTEYYYNADGSVIYQSVQIYLDCTYSSEDYNKEKERLSSLSYTDSQQITRKICLDDGSLLPYPGCYAMLYSDCCCEYALFFEEEKRIVYVYLQTVYVDDVKFPLKFLPLDYGSLADPPENQAAPYNMYGADSSTDL